MARGGWQHANLFFTQQLVCTRAMLHLPGPTRWARSSRGIQQSAGVCGSRSGPGQGTRGTERTCTAGNRTAPKQGAISGASLSLQSAQASHRCTAGSSCSLRIQPNFLVNAKARDQDPSATSQRDRNASLQTAANITGCQHYQQPTLSLQPATTAHHQGSRAMPQPSSSQHYQPNVNMLR